MAIPNYEPPSIKLDQKLDVVPSATQPARNAVVIGPKYLLSRYGLEATTPGYEHDSSAQTLPWESSVNGVATAIPADAEVDLNSVKLHGVGLEALLGAFTPSTSTKFYLDSLATPNVLKISSGSVHGTGLNEDLLGRALQVGDLVTVNDGVSGSRRRVITGFLGSAVASKYGSNSASDDTHGANSGYNPLTSTAALTVISEPSVLFTMDVDDPSNFNGMAAGSKLGSYYGERFTVTVRTGGAPGTARVDISTASGLFSATNVATADSSGDYTVTHAALAGMVLTIVKDGVTDLALGDTFVFEVKGDYARLSNTQFDVSDTGAGYTGPVDTTYAMEVITGSAGSPTGAVVRITSSSGLDPVTEVTVTDNTNFLVGAYGLRAKFNFTSAPAQGGLRKGDVYYVRGIAATRSTAAFDKLVLNGPASDTGLFTNVATAVTVDFRLPYTGEILNTDGPTGAPAWAADAGGLTVNSSLSLYVPSRSTGNKWVAYVDAVGDVYPSFRAVLMPETGVDPLTVVEDVEDITLSLGSTDPDNLLGFGALCALAGAQGPVLALQTAGTTPEAFAEALNKIGSRAEAYALTPLSNDPEVRALVKAHVVSRSSGTALRWRNAYIGVDSPGEYAAISTQANGSANLATLGESGGANIQVTATTAGVNFTASGIAAGDLFRLPGTSEEFVVASVVSATELLLESGPALPISTPTAFQIWKPDTAANQVSYLAASAASMADRRVKQVWQESGTITVNGVPMVLPNMFLACYIAGLRTSVEPHQGLSRQAIGLLNSCPAMYTRYTQSQLNEIAAAGTMVVTQDSESGAIYIRHQLTTDTTHGILYYEDSITTNVDDIAFGVIALIEGFLGKYNVNRKTLSHLQTLTTAYLQEKTTADVDSDLGPQLNAFEPVVLTIPAGAADTVKLRLRVLVPVPLNKIWVTLEAGVDPTLTGVIDVSTVIG
jgi:hypothetical protein